MRIFLTYLLNVPAMLCALHSQAQNYAVYNSYYLNPYLYNPAEVASDYTFVYVNHRMQWVGIEGAPVLTTANFNTLLNQTRTGVGAKVSSYNRGLLNTTDIAFSFAHGIPFSKANVLYFGISGGAISNSIDQTNLDTNDPAISNYMADNIQPGANFGMLYRSSSGLNLGFSLPQLFTSKYNSATNFENTSITPLDNVIVSAYFKRKVEGRIVSRNRRGVKAKVKTTEKAAPLELYLLYKYSKIGTSQGEVMAKFNLSENFWLGAAYRQNYGLTGSLGVAFNRILLSYSYEPSNQPESAFSSGTHEMQLGFRFGQQKHFRRTVPVLRSTIKTGSGEHHARFEHSAEDIDNREVSKKEEKKYFVVIKSFGDFNAADVFRKKLVDQKYNGQIFYHAKEKRYHVHVFETDKAHEAHEEVRNLKLYTKLTEAHVITVITTE